VQRGRTIAATILSLGSKYTKNAFAAGALNWTGVENLTLDIYQIKLYAIIFLHFISRMGCFNTQFEFEISKF